MFEFYLNNNISDNYPGIKEDNLYTDPELEEIIASLFNKSPEDTVLNSPGISQNIDNLFYQGKRDIFFWDEMIKFSEMLFLESCIPLKRPVVDFGCGYSYWPSKTLHEIDLGVDLFPDAGTDHSRTIKGFVERNFINNTYLSVLKGDSSCRLPIPTSSCNTALSVSHIAYSKNPEKGIEQFRRVLKPGGTLVLTISTPERFEMYRRLYSDKYYNDMVAQVPICSIMNIAEWEKLLMDNDFVIEKRTGYMDFFRNFFHTVTSYPQGYGDVTWNQKSFAEHIRNSPALYEKWKKEILPWLIAECPPEEAASVCYKCILKK